jgi:lysophospholipase L1-like esterase
LKYLISTGLKGEFGPATAQWKAEVTQQAQRSQQLHDAVVFFGDSLTVGLATSNVAARSENFGIDGDSIDWLLLRLPRYDLIGTKAIVIEIGINNWLQEGHSGFDGFANKYRTLLGSLPQSVPIVAVAILPVNSHAAALIKGRWFPGDIRQANHQIADQCRQVSNCRYLDSSILLADQSGKLKPKYDSGDGVHLSTTGYAAWSALLINSLERIDTSRDRQS